MINRSKTTPPADEGQPDRIVRRVRINVGATVGQDLDYNRWPITRSGQVVDPAMVFDAEWNGRHWECRANGFGRRTRVGLPSEYGNGALYVFCRDSVTLLDGEELSEPVSAPISAAPELLEALELMVNTYEEGGWPSATIVVAKAAIAKARGE
jgi:hypothetical protein